MTLDAVSTIPNGGKMGADGRDAGRRTVLLAEDSEEMRPLLEMVLAQCGFAVTATCNGQEALDAWHGCGGAFDLVVTDGDMPLMGGAELIRRLHQLSPGVRVLYISANPLTAARSGIPPQCDVEFLPKPFSAAALCAKAKARVDPRPPSAAWTSGE